ncbi:MAG: hypothetical protein ACTSVB_07940 [Candidatus Heimdallarchaeaceae archaeon]
MTATIIKGQGSNPVLSVKTVTSYPYPIDKGAGKKLPLGKCFGTLKADWCEAYYPNYNNVYADSPTMFVDLELSNSSVNHLDRHLQIHFGFSGNIKVKHPSNISSHIKPHFDVYLPFGCIDRLIGILERMKKDCKIGA